MKYLPARFNHVYITGTGCFLPGTPVDNDQMDMYVAPINRHSKRIKQRVLAENGIKSRYYGIDQNGRTLFSAAQMGAAAIHDGLQNAAIDLKDITLLTAATSGGDILMPGFANMLQGELHIPPMEVRSHHGICVAGVSALKDAAQAIENNYHQHAAVAAVEYPSRLFKHTRFESMRNEIDFNAHFLRWMLSDGAGCAILSRQPDAKQSLCLKLEWIHTKSFSGDFPTCMQMGNAADDATNMSFMDYSSFAAAEADGALALRQDIRLLPQLFEVGIHEYNELVVHGWLDPGTVDHFLCHYSSEKLGDTTDKLMQRCGLAIPREKWFSNLSRCGNTGSASIFIMLADFMRRQLYKAGDRIFCFVPESGRFTAAYMMFTIVNTPHPLNESTSQLAFHEAVPPPRAPESVGDLQTKSLLQELASIWHEYRSRAWRTRFVKKIISGEFTSTDYVQWMENWIPQVREGSYWMRTAVHNLSAHYQPLAELIAQHASEEQNDFSILFADYRAAGGQCESIEDLKRNPGGEALNSYMYSMAQQTDALGLLGGIYIIEGTGQRIIPVLLPRIRHQLTLPENCFQFLGYHGANDPHHLQRWMSAVELALSMRPQVAENVSREIVKTARQVAELYLMQWEFLP